MPQQPMSRGVGSGRYDGPTSPEEVSRVSERQQQEIIAEAAALEIYLRENSVVSLFVDQMTMTMKEAFLQSEKGKMQMQFLENLKIKIEPDALLELMARNEVLRHIGPRLRAIHNATPAAPK